MSRIGKKPVLIPDKVEVTLDGQEVKVKGPKGELIWDVPREISIKQEDGQLIFAPNKKDKKTNALWGLSQSKVDNLVQGVTDGFQKSLEIEGVGYRAALQGNKIVLNIGFSHPVEFEAPEGIELQVEKNTITISGIDKELVGQVAADIRSIRKPEPYKGKGIRYSDEVVRRKAGKKVASGE